MRSATSACLLLALSACKTDAVHDEVAARIVNPSTESRNELQRVISEALNRQSVVLADDALTDSSLLVIEPGRLSGRDLRKPEQFQLVLSGSTCVLVHRGTAARYELVDTSCVAESD